MRFVLAAISVSSGYGSFHSTCESKIQPYSNPAPSACRVRATMRSTEMSGLRVMPNCIAGPLVEEIELRAVRSEGAAV